MYDSWDMEHGRQNFFSFWTIFCPFTFPPKNPENQNFEKMNKTPGMYQKWQSYDIWLSFLAVDKGSSYSGKILSLLENLNSLSSDWSSDLFLSFYTVFNAQESSPTFHSGNL